MAIVEKARNPLRLREELLKHMRISQGDSTAVEVATSQEGTRLITETLVPRMAGEA